MKNIYAKFLLSYEDFVDTSFRKVLDIDTFQMSWVPENAFAFEFIEGIPQTKKDDVSFTPRFFLLDERCDILTLEEAKRAVQEKKIHFVIPEEMKKNNAVSLFKTSFGNYFPLQEKDIILDRKTGLPINSREKETPKIKFLELKL